LRHPVAIGALGYRAFLLSPGTPPRLTASFVRGVMHDMRAPDPVPAVAFHNPHLPNPMTAVALTLQRRRAPRPRTSASARSRSSAGAPARPPRCLPAWRPWGSHAGPAPAGTRHARSGAGTRRSQHALRCAPARPQDDAGAGLHVRAGSLIQPAFLQELHPARHARSRPARKQACSE